MSNKKYYWLKLKDDFFERDEIKIIESQKNGKDYINFYLKLLLKSVKTEGTLRFKDAIPYNLDMLSTITNCNIDTVNTSINTFISLGLMEKWEDGTFYMLEVQNMVGSETSSAARVRKHRLKNTKPLQCNNNVINCNTEIEIDIELESEKWQKWNDQQIQKQIKTDRLENLNLASRDNQVLE